MADRIALDFDVARQHATRVEHVASEVGLARDAVASMNMGGGAFGVLCSFLVPSATLVSSVAQQAVSSASGMVTRSAREIRNVAGDFERFEEAVAGELRRLEASVDGMRR